MGSQNSLGNKFIILLELILILFINMINNNNILFILVICKCLLKITCRYVRLELIDFIFIYYLNCVYLLTSIINTLIFKKESNTSGLCILKYII